MTYLTSFEVKKIDPSIGDIYYVNTSQNSTKIYKLYKVVKISNDTIHLVDSQIEDSNLSTLKSLVKNGYPSFNNETFTFTLTDLNQLKNSKIIVDMKQLKF